MGRLLKRWKLLGLSVAFLLAGTGLAFLIWTPLELRSKRIQEGMSQDQLAAVMGRPPDATGLFCSFWKGDGEEVQVSLSFANPRRAIGKRYIDHRPRRESLADRLFGLLKEIRMLIKP